MPSLATPENDLGKLILFTGATGYIGGRQAPRLLEAGDRVRCLVHDPTRLRVGDALVFWRGRRSNQPTCSGTAQPDDTDKITDGK